MSKKVITILFILFFVTLKVALGQDFNEEQRWRINLKAFDKIEEYSRFHSFTNNYNTVTYSYKTRFRNLFRSDSLKIYNDVIPINKYGTEITVSDYIDTLTNTYFNSGMYIKIDKIDLKIPEAKNDSVGTIDVCLRKIISGKTNYSMTEKDTFHLRITFEFKYDNLDVKSFDITKITGKKSKRFINIHLKNGKRKDNITISIQQSDTIKRYQIKSKFKKLYDIEQDKEFEITLSDPDYRFYNQRINLGELQFINKNDSLNKDPNGIYLPVKPVNFYASLDYGFLLNNSGFHFSNPQKEINSFKISNIKNSNFGITIGYKTFEYKNINSYSNLVFSSISNDFQVDLKNYDMRIHDIDPDDANYERLINIDNINERYRQETYSFGIYQNMFYPTQHHVTFEFGLGLKYHKVKALHFVSNADAQYSGLYKQYNSLIIGEKGVYDFGNYSIGKENNQSLENHDFTSAILRFGIIPDIKIIRPVKLKLMLIKNYAFGSIHQGVEGYILSVDNQEYNPLINGVEELMYNPFYLSISVMTKF